MRFSGLLLAVSAAMAVLKIVVGALTGSHAVMASALYSVNDVLSSIAVTVSLRLSRRRPTASYPYGYGKAEFVAVGMVSLSIAFGVLFMLLFSLIDVMRGVNGPPHVISLTMASLSMAVSWVLAKKGRRLAGTLDSPALATSADHHMADAEGSLLVLIGVGGALMGFHTLDRIVAIVETIHVVALSGTLLARAVKGLADTALPAEDVDLVRHACAKVPTVQRVEYVRSRRLGHQTWVDVAVAVPPGLTVRRAHGVTTAVKAAVSSVLGPSATAQVRFQSPDRVAPQPGPGGSPHG